MGYRDVVSMSGGFQQWKSLGLPWTQPALLSDEQKRRYSRHLLIPEVGAEGQAKLLASKALLVGAGGLGSPAALYLAAAGVGTIGIVDFDVVDVSQPPAPDPPHDRPGGGEEGRLRDGRRSRPSTRTWRWSPTRRCSGRRTSSEIIAGYDVILDGTDTFETRYTLNDAAVAAGIPVIHASVFRFEGQLTTFVPYEGPCYRCLYPTPPPPELAPGCSVAGVLGVVPGIMGLLQTNEALKVLLGIGETLAGRLLLFDALDASFTELKLRRDPACPVCSDEAVAAREAGTPLPVGGVGGARRRRRQPSRFPAPREIRRVSTVRIPPVLRAQVGGAKSLELAGATVGEVLDALVAAHPGASGPAATPTTASSTASSTSTSTARTSATRASWRRRSGSATRS